MSSLSRPDVFPAAYIGASGALGAKIRARQRGASLLPITADIREAARRQLALIDVAARPASPDVALAWLRKLAYAVANAPTDPAEIRARSEMIWEQCRDLPASVWCDAARVAYGRLPDRRGTFWPMPGELYEHFSGYAREMHDDRAGCEAILADTSLTVSSYVRPSLAEREAVLERFRVQKAEIRAEADAAKPEPEHPVVRPSHVRTDALIAQYRQIAQVPGSAGDAARSRLASLERLQGESVERSPAI